MTMDKLTDEDWYEIYRQTGEIGYCLYDPIVEWKPEGIMLAETSSADSGNISLPSGKFTTEELLAVLNILPVDLTFVDRDDKVKYFTQGRERIFDRNRAILGRDVRLCHPPSSVHVVEQILEDFKNGKHESCPFWINMQGKFIHIEYFQRIHKTVGLFLFPLFYPYLNFEDRPAKGFHIARLSEDYLTVEKDVALINAPLEGGAVVHYKGLYYALGSALTGWNPNPNKYATATRLEGPWSEFKDMAPPETRTYGSQSTMLLKVVGSKTTSVIFSASSAYAIMRALPIDGWVQLKQRGPRATAC